MQKATSGGEKGRQVINRLFPLVPKLLSSRGMFYLTCIVENDISKHLNLYFSLLLYCIPDNILIHAVILKCCYALLYVICGRTGWSTVRSPASPRSRTHSYVCSYILFSVWIHLEIDVKKIHSSYHITGLYF